MLSIIWTILIGFVVGVVAKFLTPGRGPSGFFLTAALGVAGSILATFLGQMLGMYRAGSGAGFIMSTIGAIVLILIWNAVAKKRLPPS